MKSIAIITLTGYFNFGNRLQNYALTKVLEKLNLDVYTVWNKNNEKKLKETIKTKLFFIKKYNRFRVFYNFSKKNMKEISLKDVQKNKIDKIIVGSDQVWNPKYYEEDNNLLYIPLSGQTVISYAASMGAKELPEKYHEIYKKVLSQYDAISVREDAAKNEIEKITGRNDIRVLIDPTLLLTEEEWKKIEKKPKKFDNNKKYILNYFLGDISKEEKKSIEAFVKENNCEIINILDENDKFYQSGPEEFLYLINHSYLVCTDSFHSCVFSFIFNKPFVVFKRKGCSDYMYSRIETLLQKFNLRNREFSGQIDKKVIDVDYNEAYNILKEEQEKSNEFLKKALET